MIDAYVIRIRGDEKSEEGAKNLIESSQLCDNEFQIQEFDAIVPDQVDQLMKENRIKWNYPWEGKKIDLDTGLTKTAYPTADPKKRIACFLSHYLLWKKCAEEGKELLIFEHDAVFYRKVNLEMLQKSRFDVIALNNPIGATRKSKEFYNKVSLSKSPVCQVPQIDNYDVPQGLPGNSAYYINPKGAMKLEILVNAHGAWPNDAIMCRQLMPNQLGVVKEYCTGLQKMESTTTL